MDALRTKKIRPIKIYRHITEVSGNTMNEASISKYVENLTISTSARLV